MRAVYFLLIFMFISATALGGVRERVYRSAKEFFTSSRRPEYPLEARRKRQVGDGRFRLYIGKSGRVTSVKMLRSTGHSLLDNAAVKAYMSWKAPPGLRREADVPVSFSMVEGSFSPPHQMPPFVVREFTD